ncbi:hypothetical protein TS71_09610 [Mycolicibacterium neoaurum]|nr:hypothetical protein DXK33_15895 [Mycolicibacterium neoaurum]KJQ50833.1 hypothetical protein TS71_09610 [Mycolicibacterium neoaurum]KUM10028.1 hypothetical protein AVZ31_04140 [Mycolicibacterium neoaurum]
MGDVMFERAKYMVSFVGAYRRARRHGDEHQSALARAADDMFAGPGIESPDSVHALWCDPDEHVTVDGGGWFGAGAFDITAAHLDLLRHARLGWDGAERGAPCLDPTAPYGRADLLSQLGEVFETDAVDELARRHVEMYFVLARFLRHAVLEPGQYRMRNVTAPRLRAVLRGYGELRDEDLGLGAYGVLVEPEHLQLLRGIEIRWPSPYECADRLAAGRFPAAGADPKRPYGDFTFIEVDMARILGVLPPPPSEGPAVFEPGPELARRLQRLHWQMLSTMQVFLEHAELAPGRYELN